MNIIKAKDFKPVNLSVLLYGSPGMGKTTALGHLKGRTLLVDVDGGACVLAGAENVDIVRVSDNVKEIEDIIKELHSKCKYDNVCIDSLSELERSMLSYLGRQGNNKGVPSLGDYNRVDCFLIDWCRRFRTLPANIFFTAWERYLDITNPGGDKVTVIRPLIRDKTVDNLCGLCDIVGRFEVSPETKERFILLKGNSRKIAKDRIFKREFCRCEDILPQNKQ